MAEPTLQQVFGTNATQDANILTIKKSDLTGVGLTPAATNTAESLVVALVKLWEKTLTATNQESNPEQQITIEDGFPSIVFRNNSNYRQYPKTIAFQKVDNSTDLDPDDY
ncbi:hypothetical protein BZZ01_20240 [Nostocales cyanobacterium HT-58-2]|nr:hypothetical protein BZZ01_20240 [Nostocales cyanobacterium HT-58-2]